MDYLAVKSTRNNIFTSIDKREIDDKMDNEGRRLVRYKKLKITEAIKGILHNINTAKYPI